MTGIILTGGKSSRMGQDKAFVPFSGKPLIEIMIDKLSCLFSNLIIIANKPHLYKKYGIRIRTDIIKDLGPLGGIYTGLRSSDTMHNFIVACDMPFLNQDLVKFMSERIGDYDVIIPQHGRRLEPLCAIYSKTCIKPIEAELQKNNYKIIGFFSYVKVKIVTRREIAIFDTDRRCFANINTPRDYQSIMR